jgi:hypothetical protein
MSLGATLICGVCATAIAVASCARGAEPGREDERVAFREDAIARAQVFRGPVSFEALAPRSAQITEIDCRFLLTDATGTTPKFDCEQPDGTRIKVKYGRAGEIAGEIAATRLLLALGFGADRVMFASRVRCYGCPASPFYARRLASLLKLDHLLRQTRDYGTYRDFERASVEYKLEGLAVEAAGLEGWSFSELDKIDRSRGGASRAEVDALRLMAIFLAHWDNKASNQRLVCLPPDDGPDGCRQPLVMLHDVGGTFGPRMVDLEAWRRTPIWADADRCLVTMKRFPYIGGTFAEVQISERGRRLLADRLLRLPASGVETIFREAHFPQSADAWAAVFREKVHQIASRAPCPAAAALS